MPEEVVGGEADAFGGTCRAGRVLDQRNVGGRDGRAGRSGTRRRDILWVNDVRAQPVESQTVSYLRNLLVVCGVDDDRARRAISRDRMEAVRVLRPQRREARHRNRAELHESVQPGDVVEAGVQRENNTVTGADTALTQVSSVRFATGRSSPDAGLPPSTCRLLPGQSLVSPRMSFWQAQAPSRMSTLP